MKHPFLLFSFFACSLWACSQVNNPQKVEQNAPTQASTQKQVGITKISFISKGCYGTCPVESIEMDSSLTVVFAGKKFTTRLGLFEGKISRQFWESLDAKLEAANYKSLKSEYYRTEDSQVFEIIIHSNTGVKHVYGTSSDLPQAFYETLQWLMAEVDKTAMAPKKDGYRFEVEKTK